MDNPFVDPNFVELEPRVCVMCDRIFAATSDDELCHECIHALEEVE